MRSLKSEVERQARQLGGIAHARIVLVVLIVGLQSFEVAGGPTRLGPLALWPIQIVAISGLFALSGYVLTASRPRHSVKGFLLHRLRSTYPAYAAIILLSFAALGPLASDNAAGGYFRDGESWLYLLNLIGVPVFDLPGVFEFNLVRLTVNAVVALAPAYIVLTVLIGAMPRLGRWFTILCGTLLLAVPILLTALELGGMLSIGRGSALREAVVGSGLAALCGGIVGSLAQQFGGHIPFDRKVQAAAFGAIGLVSLIATRVEMRDLPLFHAVLAVPAAYLAITLSVRYRRVAVPQLAGLALHPLLVSAFPIQQIVSSAGAGSVANFAVAIVAAASFGLAFAYLTDRFVPKPDGYRAQANAAAPSFALPSLATLRRKALSVAAGAAVGMIFAAIVVAVMALTFYAIQRPPEGI